MYRRRFLQSGAALAVSGFQWPQTLAAQSARPPSLKRLSAPAAFDYARLKGVARSMANAPYQGPAVELPPRL